MKIQCEKCENHSHDQKELDSESPTLENLGPGPAQREEVLPVNEDNDSSDESFSENDHRSMPNYKLAATVTLLLIRSYFTMIDVFTSSQKLAKSLETRKSRKFTNKPFCKKGKGYKITVIEEESGDFIHCKFFIWKKLQDEKKSVVRRLGYYCFSWRKKIIRKIIRKCKNSDLLHPSQRFSVSYR
jgi:hypothetical protein